MISLLNAQTIRALAQAECELLHRCSRPCRRRAGILHVTSLIGALQVGDDRATWPVWLSEPADTAELKAMLAPYPADEMICWPVSARVGNVRNNDSSLIEPLAQTAY